MLDVCEAVVWVVAGAGSVAGHTRGGGSSAVWSDAIVIKTIMEDKLFDVVRTTACT